MRFFLATHLPNHALCIFKTQIDLSKHLFPASLDSSEYAGSMFEKDVSEAIGFTNGNRMHTDTNETGMLGVMCLLNFLEKLDN